MKIETKRVLEGIIFNDSEKLFMTTFANIMDEECGNHDSCETCPFADYINTYTNCSGFRDVLHILASEGEVG